MIQIKWIEQKTTSQCWKAKGFDLCPNILALHQRAHVRGQSFIFLSIRGQLSQLYCICESTKTKRIRRVKRLHVPSRFQSTNMISVEKLENTQHCLSWLSDCAIYIANEHEVHENIPNFGFSKSPCHLLFCSATNTHTNSSPLHPPRRLRLQSFHCIHLMNMLIVHSSANCVWCFWRNRYSSNKKGSVYNWLLKEEGCDKHRKGGCQFCSIHPCTASLYGSFWLLLCLFLFCVKINNWTRFCKQLLKLQND